MSRAQQTNATYAYSSSVPAGYTSIPSSIQPLPPTTPQLSVPPPAISIPNKLPKPIIPPNSKSTPLAHKPLPAMPLMEVQIPTPLEEEPLTMSLAEVPKPMLPELPMDKVEFTRPLLRRFQLRAESSIFLSRRNTSSMSKSRRFIKSQLRLRSSSTRRLSATREFPMRELSLITMPLRLKSSTSVEKSRRP